MGRLARHTVGVVGSGTLEHNESARPIGELLASLGVNLLTGGGRGVMRSVSRAFTESPGGRGICIGILPCASEADRSLPKPGYPNEFVELAIQTHLPYSGRQGQHDLSRNHINVLSCDVIVALPGEEGTASEVALALLYGKPVVAYASSPNLIDHFPVAVPRARSVDEVRGFLRERLRDRNEDDAHGDGQETSA
jgi:uncharacterized protein (TIGR00725 family)